MTTWEPLVTAVLAFCVLALALSSISRILVWCVVRHGPKGQPSSARVTILKPLCGADTSLTENLAALAQQSHQRLEIVFGVAEQGDEALGCALAFCRAHAYARMTGERVPLAAVALNPLRQCVTLAIWVMAWFVHSIEWRGKVYRIGPESRLEPLPQLAAAEERGAAR